MTFDELKKRSAADLREIASFLEHRAKQVEAGDLQVMEALIDEEWGRWFEMLLIRYAWGQEQRREAGYAEPDSPASERCKHGNGEDCSECAKIRAARSPSSGGTVEP